jgi:pimeloyl-ACP methyl ester carboxylesterase
MPPEHGRRLAAIIPNARHAEIEDAYTLLPLDQPERVAEHIGAFVGSLA